MDLLLFRSEEYQRRYNCSTYAVESIPDEERYHPVVGALFILFGLFYVAIYLPCMFAMTRSRNFRQPCYRLMFALGVAQISGIAVTGFVAGYLAIEGAVFCTHPTLIYVAGSLGMSVWFADASLSILLALNRCLIMYDSRWSDRIFRGWRTNVMLLMPFGCFFYFFWFSPPCIFSGIYDSWFFNPHIGYMPDDPYFHNPLHMVFNWSVLALLLLIYVTFFVLFLRKYGKFTKRKHLSSFVQVGIICILGASTSLVYNHEHYFQSRRALILMTTFGYICYQGSPAVIYLLMNKTLKNDIRRALFGKASAYVHSIDVPPTGSGSRR